MAVPFEFELETATVKTIKWCHVYEIYNKVQELYTLASCLYKYIKQTLRSEHIHNYLPDLKNCRAQENPPSQISLFFFVLHSKRAVNEMTPEISSRMRKLLHESQKASVDISGCQDLEDVISNKHDVNHNHCLRLLGLSLLQPSIQVPGQEYILLGSKDPDKLGNHRRLSLRHSIVFGHTLLDLAAGAAALDAVLQEQYIGATYNVLFKESRPLSCRLCKTPKGDCGHDQPQDNAGNIPLRDGGGGIEWPIINGGEGGGEEEEVDGIWRWTENGNDEEGRGWGAGGGRGGDDNNGPDRNHIELLLVTLPRLCSVCLRRFIGWICDCSATAACIFCRPLVDCSQCHGELHRAVDQVWSPLRNVYVIISTRPPRASENTNRSPMLIPEHNHLLSPRSFIDVLRNYDIQNSVSYVYGFSPLPWLCSVCSRRFIGWICDCSATAACIFCRPLVDCSQCHGELNRAVDQVWSPLRNVYVIISTRPPPRASVNTSPSPMLIPEHNHLPSPWTFIGVVGLFNRNIQDSVSYIYGRCPLPHVSLYRAFVYDA